MDLLPPITREQLSDLQQRYPRSMKCFEKWYSDFRLSLPKYPDDFEDLSQPLQLGLWIEFVRQQGHHWFTLDSLFQPEQSKEMESFFNEILEPHLTNNQPDKPLTECMAGRDTECNHPKCPVTDEDAKNGRYCPLPLYDYRQ